MPCKERYVFANAPVVVVVVVVAVVVLRLYVFFHHEGDFKDGGTKERAYKICLQDTKLDTQ